MSIPRIEDIKLRAKKLGKFEMALRDYYLANGVVCPFSELGSLLEGILDDESMISQRDSMESQFLLDIFRRLTQKQTGTLEDEYFINLEYDISVLYHPRYFESGRHKHDFYEVAYVYSGQAKQTIWAGVSKTMITQNAGSFLIMPPGVSHAILVDDNSLVFNLVMRTNACKSSLLNNLPSGSELEMFFLQTLYSDDPVYLILHTKNDEEIQNKFFDIMTAEYATSPYRREIINLLTSVFFLHLLCNIDTAIDVHRTNMKDADYIPAIIQYMEKNYQTVTSGEISRVFGFSQAYIGSFYKRYTGSTLTQTIQSIRLRHAVELLLETHGKISEICEMVGYKDITSFIRQFKRKYGQTPYQYRLNADNLSKTAPNRAE